MIRDGEHHDERYEDEPFIHAAPEPEPEPVAPWNDLEHAYHEHDERL